MNHCIESHSEQRKRIEAMLETLVFETWYEALRNNESPKRLSLQEIADFCGCSRGTIERIEQEALCKIKELLPL